MLRLLTPSHRGDLLAFSTLLLVDFIFVFLIHMNIILIFGISIFIFYIYVHSEIREEPFFTPKEGIFVLILAILFLLGISFLINQMVESDPVIFWAFIIGIITIFVLFIINFSRISGEKQGSELYSSQNIKTYYSRDPDDSRYIPSDVVKEVMERDQGRCVICKSDRQIELDHRIPYSMGGSNTANNIRILCKKCNRRKSDKIE